MTVRVDYQRFIELSDAEASAMAVEIDKRTGFKISPDDPMIAMLIAQRRWLELEWKNQNQQNEKDIQNLNAFFNNLHDLLPKIQQAEKSLQQKCDYLQKENEILKSFRNEVVAYFTAQAKENVEPFVADMVEKRLSGKLNTWHLKSHLIFGGVIVLQVIILLLLLFK